MPLKTIKALLRALPLCLLIAGLGPAARAAVSTTSKRVIRPAAAIAISAQDFDAVALSTTSIQWSWSTGPFVGSGITSFRLHTASAAAYADLSPSTSFYIDTGLGANRAYTRWIAAYDGVEEGSDSEHIQKYTYAMPPVAITLSTITAESVYVTWQFSSATAYAVECSTSGGADYIRNRDVFVPWQTIELLSNRSYMIRLGAVNGDNELTPGIYSVIRTTVTPPLDQTLTGVAVSSYTIEWQWSTGTFTGTDIAGYRVYHSTTTSDDAIPTDSFDGEAVSPTLSAATTFWIETYIDASTTAVAANSRHNRWIKAVGNIDVAGNPLISQGKTDFQRYTYAIAPATTTVVWKDPDPYWVAHVWENSLQLIWSPRVASSEANKYLVEYSTVAGFAVAVSTKLTAGNPDTVTGLVENTKYDLRLGAINGDEIQTPDNAANPFAYSQAYKVMTRPSPPSAFACNSHTDTALRCTWSTSTYVNTTYIDGYSVGKLLYRMVNDVLEIYWDPLDFLPGIASNQYDLDYLLPNSTHTVSVWTSQVDPAWIAGNPGFDADPQNWDLHYANFGSYRLDKDAATFATPPNDVTFYTVRSSTVGMVWNEPIVPATKYRVERTTVTVGFEDLRPWVFVSSVSGNTFLDTGLSPLTTYSYRIGAINLLEEQTIGLSTATDGNRRDYSFVVSTLTRHISPTLSGVATSATSINWLWTNTVAGVLTYNLYTSTDGIIAAGLTAASTPYAEINLSSANARYTRRVRSLTAFGDGDYSEASVSTLANPPAAPVIISSGVHTLSVGWAANGSARYGVDRSPDGNVWTVLKSSADVFVSTSFNDAHLRYATTYFYAISGYNDDNFVSLSSAITPLNTTLPLPSTYTVVFATAVVSQDVIAALPGFGQWTVTIPAGTPESYFGISTVAATAPVEISLADLSAATAKLAGHVSLANLPMVELHLYDANGYPLTGDLPSPARITVTYPDAPVDDVVDGTAFQVTSLRLFSLDTAALVWNQQMNSMLDKGAKTVYADVPHFSFYALGSITSAAGSISDMFAYPNPYKPGSTGLHGQSVYGDGVVFESLPARSTVKIYNLAGGLVRELTDDDGDGRCFWNARNSDGARAASGTYLYLVASPAGGKKSGRIAIIK